MRILPSILCALALVLDASAQGTLVFRNHGNLIDAPVFDVDGRTPLAGSAYCAQLYLGVSPDSLGPVSSMVTFRERTAAGYLPATLVTIEGWGPRYFQIRAWESSAGATYEEAVAAGGRFGFSNTILVDALVPPAGPGEPIGLESFHLIPEPATRYIVLFGFFLMAGRKSRS